MITIPASVVYFILGWLAATITYIILGKLSAKKKGK